MNYWLPISREFRKTLEENLGENFINGKFSRKVEETLKKVCEKAKEILSIIWGKNANILKKICKKIQKNVKRNCEKFWEKLQRFKKK